MKSKAIINGTKIKQAKITKAENAVLQKEVNKIKLLTNYLQSMYSAQITHWWHLLSTKNSDMLQ